MIAVDGPSGSGKSSAARGTAMALGLRYLDTGAMYRAVAWWLLEHDIDVTDADSVAAVTPGLVIEISTEPGDQAVRVDGVDVTAGIRSRRVSNAVSSVASVPQVRGHLIAIQREIIGRAVASSGGIVAEGRDIGTVVAPDAAVKVFLTASEQARAERRAAEMAERAAAGASAAASLAGLPDQAPTADLTRIEQARRDRRDAPQTQRAADAIEIDATELGLDEVIGRIVRLAASRAGAA
ncbi:MAG TPA: (d)CMP kinase [Streptosporangiaceae bacterium]|nr:(d)CMP kinase [Streptosporangiaceae bacterium]